MGLSPFSAHPIVPAMGQRSPRAAEKKRYIYYRHDVVLHPKICGLVLKGNFALGYFGAASRSSSDHFSCLLGRKGEHKDS